ncbi:MAG: TlpA disulfide reductase family protein [Ginsengibacter sp.]
MKKKHFTLSNITTWLFVAFIASMLIFPGVKAGVIRGLMTVGLFQPKIPTVDENESIKKIAGPSFVLSDQKGQSVDIADLKGKVLFINFWATWCPPCIAEMPSIETLFSNFKENENVVFLMIDADNNPQKSIEFMKKNKWTLPVYFPAGNIPNDYFTGTLPTTVIMDKNGNITYNHSGTADYSSQKFKNYLEELSKK